MNKADEKITKAFKECAFDYIRKFFNCDIRKIEKDLESKGFNASEIKDILTLDASSNIMMFKFIAYYVFLHEDYNLCSKQDCLNLNKCLEIPPNAWFDDFVFTSTVDLDSDIEELLTDYLDEIYKSSSLLNTQTLWLCEWDEKVFDIKPKDESLHYVIDGKASKPFIIPAESKEVAQSLAESYFHNKEKNVVSLRISDVSENIARVLRLDCDYPEEDDCEYDYDIDEEREETDEGIDETAEF